MTAASMAIPPQTEKQFQAAVVELARTLGYLTFHTYDSRRSNPGFPDLVLLKPPRLIFMECKRKGGRSTLAQRVWITALQRCGIEAHFVTPDDWELVISLLQSNRAGAWATDIALQNDVESC